MNFEEQAFSPAERPGLTPEQIMEAELFLSREEQLSARFAGSPAEVAAEICLLLTREVIKQASEKN